MATMTIRLEPDPNTQRRSMVVAYTGDEGATRKEHEEKHRRLVDSLLTRGSMSGLSQHKAANDLSQYKAVLVVFAMKGCPACKEFLPRFRRLAKSACVPVFILDSDDDRWDDYSNRFDVKYMPTMVVAQRPTGYAKWEGAVVDEQIAQAIHLAERTAGCR